MSSQYFFQNEQNQIKKEFIKGEIVSTTTSDRVESFDPKINQFPDYKVSLENGEEVQVYSNALKYKSGTEVYIQKDTLPGGEIYYVLNEKVRTNELLFSLIFFILFVIMLFGKKGVKSLISLAFSLSIIIFVLLPLTLKGYNPVLIASFISVILLSSIMLITNGRNKITYAALAGCAVSIFLTILLSFLIVGYSAISGHGDEMWSYFAFATDIKVNFSLLVIASMIIGVIGAVDDGAITQSSVVAELKKANPNLEPIEYYRRAMVVGKNHGGAMINTLVMAYVGSALPLLLYITIAPAPLNILINQEIIAIEIFRSLIGSVGLLLAIPLTTICAVFMIQNKDLKNLSEHSHGGDHEHIGHNH